MHRVRDDEKSRAVESRDVLDVFARGVRRLSERQLAGQDIRPISMRAGFKPQVTIASRITILTTQNSEATGSVITER